MHRAVYVGNLTEYLESIPPNYPLWRTSMCSSSFIALELRQGILWSLALMLLKEAIKQSHKVLIPCLHSPSSLTQCSKRRFSSFSSLLFPLFSSFNLVPFIHDSLGEFVEIVRIIWTIVRLWVKFFLFFKNQDWGATWFYHEDAYIF